MPNPKSQTLNPKQYLNSNVPNSKPYNLEERTYDFARRVNVYVKRLSRTITNIENGKQLTRSAGSVAANYIEANEALSKKDFLMRVRISKKETKESRLWLRLTNPSREDEAERTALIQESNELMRIFGAIIENSK